MYTVRTPTASFVTAPDLVPLGCPCYAYPVSLFRRSVTGPHPPGGCMQAGEVLGAGLRPTPPCSMQVLIPFLFPWGIFLTVREACCGVVRGGMIGPEAKPCVLEGIDECRRRMPLFSLLSFPMFLLWTSGGGVSQALLFSLPIIVPIRHSTRHTYTRRSKIHGRSCRATLYRTRARPWVCVASHL